MPLTSALSSTLPLSQQHFAQPKGTVAAYFALHFFAFTSLSVLFVTFAVGKVKRDKTIWSLLAVFMVASWATSLVFVSGTLFPDKDGKDNTPFGLCLVNAAFIVGGTTSMSVAALNIVLNILFRIIAAKGRLILLAESRYLSIFFLVSPWLFWLSFLIAGIAVGNSQPDKVYKAVFYCAIDNDTLTTSSTIVNAIVEVMNLIVQIAIGVLLFLHHRSLNRLLGKSHPIEDEVTASQLQSRTPSRSPSTSIGGVSLPLVFRLVLFQVCVIIALGVSIAVAGDFTSLLGDFCITAIGPLVFFIFSSQADVLRAWHLLRPETSIFTLPYADAHVRSNAARGLDSNPNDHGRSESASSAFDFTHPNSRVPKLPLPSSSSNKSGGLSLGGQEFALGTLRFSSPRRDAAQESEDDSVEGGGKLSVQRTRSVGEGGDQSSLDDGDDDGVGAEGGGEGGSVAWGSTVALRKKERR